MEDFSNFFNFSAFEHDDFDAQLIADNHLFSNGPDLFGHFVGDASQAATMPPTSMSDYIHQGFEQYQRTDTSDEPASLVFYPSESQSMISQYQDDSFRSMFPTPVMPVPTLTPNTYFDGASGYHMSYPRVVPLATPSPGFGEQQHRPIFADEQVQPFQQQPQVAYIQSQPLPTIEDQHEVSLQPSLQTPENEPPSSDTRPSPTSNQPVQGSSSEQDSSQPLNILSNEQIQLLQNAEPDENAQVVTEHAAAQTAQATESYSSEDESPPKNPRTVKAAATRRTHGSQDQILSHTTISDSIYKNLRESRAAIATRHIESSWEPPNPDNTIPGTDRQRSEYVVMMCNAFQDTSSCKDNKRGHSFLKRWNDSGYYNINEIEIVCWDMLDLAERLHTQGPVASKLFCKDALKKLHASRFLTFEQRIHSICAVLRYSKYTCDKLMKDEEIAPLVTAPRQKLSGAKCMVEQNRKRQECIANGRKKISLLAAGGQNDDVESDGDEGPQRPQPTQRKAKKSGRPGRPAKPRSRKNVPPVEESSDEEAGSGLMRRSSAPWNSPDVDSNYLQEVTYSEESSMPPAASAPREPASQQSTSPPLSQSVSKSKPQRRAPSPQVHIPYARSNGPRPENKAQTLVKSNAEGRTHKRSIDHVTSESEEERFQRPEKRQQMRFAPMRARTFTMRHPSHDEESSSVEGASSAASEQDADEHDRSEEEQDGSEAGQDVGSGDEEHTGDDDYEEDAYEEHNENNGDSDAADEDESDSEPEESREIKDSEEEEENSEADRASARSATPSPSPTRQGRMARGARRGAIVSTRPLVMVATRTAKPAPEDSEKSHI
ncbi:hypothetical protein OPT61_g4518 [Boeremia exigua]|uniref:Uncharacterized protein n=1 Tax=Boeremia exigua TaxID=749465 RepID=A0ACC2IDR2_9PLEO|nr:hypothetical protein OPT61_g4518 [Boeremia exigua]